MFELKRIFLSAGTPVARSRTFRRCTGIGPMPVWIIRSGPLPCRTTRRRPSGRRFLGEGRRQIRRVLYMAATSTMLHPGFLADFIRRMKNAGKPGKVIVMAVARKLLTIANSILRSGELFHKPA